jgi:Fe-S oxidoreductase
MSYEAAKSAVVLAGLVVAGGIFGLTAYRLLWVNLRAGRPSGPLGGWWRRFLGLMTYVGGQRRLFRLPVPGIAHFLIFWGFVLLALTIVEAILEGLLALRDPDYLIPVLGDWGPLAFAQDVAAALVAGAVLYALYVRLVVDPERYRASHKSQGVIVLGFILTIVVSLLIMNGAGIELGEDPVAEWRPVSDVVGQGFAGLGDGALEVVVEVAYWIHLLVVLVFLVELPRGKHFHVVTSIPAVLLRNLEPPGRLPAVRESNGAPGVGAIEHFTWRQMLDFYTCTECGRCQDACPAHAAGLPLSPKLLMMELRDRLKERGDGQELLSGGAAEDAVWSCVTCLACDQECPLFIEHVTPIVELRRHLVVEGAMDHQLQQALENLGRYGNSFGQSERARAKWTKDLGEPVKDARREPVEYLWFVGDYASYHPAVAGITRTTAEVFGEAGLDFGILYDGERNAGNDVRRVGEEGLFEMLVEDVVGSLEGCEYEAVVTTDPHSYNTLSHEYPMNGRPVLHYTELLDRLISAGDLVLPRPIGSRVTYHDPCYLGRYNGVYSPPRRVLAAAGCEVVEMPRHGDRAFCCGAGGGRIWMEEGPMTERPAVMRVREALALDDVEALVVSCPKDYVMFQDALKTVDHGNGLVVKDLIEVIREAL